MFKKLSTFILSLSIFLAFPVLAFASNGSFTASNYSFNKNTGQVNFTASDVSSTCTGHYNDIYVANSDHSTIYYSMEADPELDPSTTNFDETLSHFSYPDMPTDSTNVYLVLSCTAGPDSFYISQGIPANSLLKTTIGANPSSSTVTVGTPFNVDVAVSAGNEVFNAAQATVTLSSNLSITGINYPTSNSCNFNYTERPTSSDPSFAGAIFGDSSGGCTAYTLTLTPTASGTGTVSFSDGSVKAYADHSEILTGVQNGSYTIDAATATPTPTPTLGPVAITSPLVTYNLPSNTTSDFTLIGTNDSSITTVFVNASSSGVTYPTSTTWNASETLNSLGTDNVPSNTTFTAYGTDGDGNQTATTSQTISFHTLGDLSGNGTPINLTDASLFAQDFGKCAPDLMNPLSDMTGDGCADLASLSVLAKLEE